MVFLMLTTTCVTSSLFFSYKWPYYIPCKVFSSSIQHKDKNYYSADTRTMNAMALFLLYLSFFFTYFNIFFPTSQSQPRVDATAETFSTLFSKWCRDFKQWRRHFFQFFFRFFLNHVCFASLQKWDIVPVKPV